ncbi:hypothetical protein V1512DRAFT_252113 [Lipomyces arxii]|uniref:uncharacterized protein n=1 Tax=Lipomyces arxii TaxID=56418 RepID=UPI0034CFDB3D
MFESVTVDNVILSMILVTMTLFLNAIATRLARKIADYVFQSTNVNLDVGNSGDFSRAVEKYDIAREKKPVEQVTREESNDSTSTKDLPAKEPKSTPEFTAKRANPELVNETKPKIIGACSSNEFLAILSAEIATQRSARSGRKQRVTATDFPEQTAKELTREVAEQIANDIVQQAESTVSTTYTNENANRHPLVDIQNESSLKLPRFDFRGNSSSFQKNKCFNRDKSSRLPRNISLIDFDKDESVISPLPAAYYASQKPLMGDFVTESVSERFDINISTLKFDNDLKVESEALKTNSPAHQNVPAPDEDEVLITANDLPLKDNQSIQMTVKLCDRIETIRPAFYALKCMEAECIAVTGCAGFRSEYRKICELFKACKSVDDIFVEFIVGLQNYQQARDVVDKDIADIMTVHEYCVNYCDAKYPNHSVNVRYSLTKEVLYQLSEFCIKQPDVNFELAMPDGERQKRKQLRNKTTKHGKHHGKNAESLEKVKHAGIDIYRKPFSMKGSF